MNAFHQRTVISFVASMITTLLAMTPVRLAQPLAGQLDQTFGTGGIARTDQGGDYQIYNHVAVQPDGKIVAAGRLSYFGGWALARYNQDGSLDAGFASSGAVLSGLVSLWTR